MDKSVQIGDHQWPRIGLGCMGLSQSYGEADPEQNQQLLKDSIAYGCTVLNTADVYGCGANERLIGEFLKTSDRSKIFLITKVGFQFEEGGTMRPEVNLSREYILSAVDKSIERLGTTPDAYIAHRVDKKVPIEETAAALDEIRKAGKTKYIGLSEASAETVRRASKVAKIDFLEVEFSPWSLDIQNNGVLDVCKELGIIILAYSPLGRGVLTGRFKSTKDFQAGDSRSGTIFPRFHQEVFDKNMQMVHKLEDFAKRKGCTTGQVSLAWLMAQSPLILPIPGTKATHRMQENFDAQKVELSTQDLQEINTIIRDYAPVGERYSEMFAALGDK